MDNNLQNFSKHVPQILRQQLLLKLSKKFLNETHEEWNQEEVRAPSIQRFRGALLFVDISGFTVLSQRLDIESLKNHINDYFTKMLTIVDKWGGDVIKFAGDALFIIWHSQILDSEEHHHSSQNHAQQQGKEAPMETDFSAENNQSSKKAKLPAADVLMSEAAERAIACALEICASCGHYEVKLQRTGSDAHTHMFDRFMPARRNSAINSGKVAPLDAVNSPMKSIHHSNNNKSSNSNGSNVSDENNVTYLDVHCGISMGLMASIDIGQGDRWEFFLAGHPLSDVAEAEERAKKGDVVVSELLHRAVHRDACTNVHEEFVDSEGNSILSCGCALLTDGYCRVKKVDIKPPRKARKNRLKARKEGFQAIAYENSRIIEDTTHDMEMLFIALYPIFRRMYQMLTNPNPNNNTNSPHGMLVRPQSGRDAPSSSNMNGNNGAASTAVVPARRTKDRRNDQLAAFINMELKRTYYSSISKVLTDDLARHVHDAVRSDYEFNDISDCEDFWDTTNSMPGRPLPMQNNVANVQGAALAPQLGLVTNDENSSHGSGHLNGSGFSANLMVLTNTNNTPTAAGIGNSNNHFPTSSSPSVGGASNTNTSISLRKSSHHHNHYTPNNTGNNNSSVNATNVTAAQLAVSSEILTSNAEVRSVTVMFIKIDTINLQLFVDEAENCNQEDVRVPDDEHNKVFGFLVRTEQEIAADTAILQKLQDCFSILHSAIYGNGGQLRQFIVDDKGTVCIATFGLRGAVSVDNAASSIETAHQIIQALPSLQLSASIGITTGKAYCGLVGSPLRHEYAVMGPSTNLSARLMCKAGPNTVICDEDTMRRDRLHEYQPLSEIQAKGYANPVKIFRPAFQGIMPEAIKPSPFHPANQLHNAHGHARGHPLPPPTHPGAQNSGSNVNNSGTHLTLKVAARQVGRARKDTRFASMYTYLMRKMHLDWILSNRSKWELEIRDMINSPFFYENEFNKAQRKSITETSF
jgi:class 3 adenylate cyclase